MRRAFPRGEPDGALAAVFGGAVTRERLQEAASRAGRGNAPLVRSLLAQALPTNGEIARTYMMLGRPPRIDASFLEPCATSIRLLDPALLRELRCVPVAMLDGICVLAVAEGFARRATETVKDVLGDRRRHSSNVAA